MSDPSLNAAPSPSAVPGAVAQSRILGLLSPDTFDKLVQAVIEKYLVLVVIAALVYGGYVGIWEPESKRAEAKAQRLTNDQIGNRATAEAMRDTARSMASIQDGMKRTAESLERSIERAERLSQPN